MTDHEKRRILDADIKALIDEFLDVRHAQTTEQDQEEHQRLEQRAQELLCSINSKNADIARLFPEEANLPAASMDIFKKRDLLQLQLNQLPLTAPGELKKNLELDLAAMCQMIEALGSYRLASH